MSSRIIDVAGRVQRCEHCAFASESQLAEEGLEWLPIAGAMGCVVEGKEPACGEFHRVVGLIGILRGLWAAAGHQLPSVVGALQDGDGVEGEGATNRASMSSSSKFAPR